MKEPLSLCVYPKNEDQFDDIVLNSAYFAALCGFDYPEINSGTGVAEIKITMKEQENEMMFRWHNKVYEPVIVFQYSPDGSAFSIRNNVRLPHPVIQRTESWLKALHLYVGEHYKKECPDDNRRIEIARNRFFEAILNK